MPAFKLFDIEILDFITCKENSLLSHLIFETNFRKLQTQFLCTGKTSNDIIAEDGR